MVSGRKSGSVLAAIVLVLLGMTLLAHGAFVLARRQLRISEVSRELLRASLAAEAGLASASRDGQFHQSLQASPVSVAMDWGERSTFRVGSRALTAELSWMFAEGESNALPVPVRLGRLIWSLDPIARVVTTRAVASASWVVAPGTSAGGWWSIPLAADSAACSAALVEMSLRGARTPVGTRTTLDSVALGRIPLAALEAFADLSVSGAVAPAPVVNGIVCQEGLPENWGDPSSSISPCARFFPSIWGPSDLRIVGGVGQGILMVTGAVSFSAGARFRGVVLAGRDVTVEAGSSIEGLVIGGSAIRVEPGGEIRGSACSAWAALNAATGLHFPIQIEPGRRFFLP
jgi:Tfp pilus assembly protein PilX